MPDTIRFLRAGRIEEISACEPERTVLDWLREDRRLRGTKEGCNEGDCGACTVVLGELDGQGIRYRAMNACILFLPVLDGRQLITVEELAGPGDELHPVQQAMVDNHGSQCGFCTPGFVMSLFAMYHDEPKRAANRTEINLGLAGNLCRCTGYAPIVRAAEMSLHAGRQDRFDAQQAQTVERLKSIQRTGDLAVAGEHGRYFAPSSLDRLAALLAEHPDAQLVAGATDVGLWVTKDLRRFAVMIHTGRVPELTRIETVGNELSIGAAVTYSDALEAITEAWPGFTEVMQRLGGWQVRNAGTIGGNIGNGSPIGDSPPGLIALGAQLVLRSSAGQRSLPLEDYFIDYGEQDLRPGEFIEKILLPLPQPESGKRTLFSNYKISKRFEQDISAVCAAFMIELLDGRVTSARVAFGGMAAIPRRALVCEDALRGRPWTEATVSDAMQALGKDFAPITDMRASAAYRATVAANLLRRFFLESEAPAHPVSLEPAHEPA